MIKRKPYINRDLSWLSFNYRVLLEAKSKSVGIFDRIKFIAIYSSNLDEFFRVRVAHIKSLSEIDKKKINKKLTFEPKVLLEEIHDEVGRQLDEYGIILRNEIIPTLRKNNVAVYMGEKIEKQHIAAINWYFKTKVLAFLHPVVVSTSESEENNVHFLENRELYFAFRLKRKNAEGDDSIQELGYVNIPSNHLSRFYTLPKINDHHYMVTLDDIIYENLDFIFPNHEVLECTSIKLNRDAELNIEDEYSGDLIEKIKKRLSKRKTGIPSRFLYNEKASQKMLDFLINIFQLNPDDLVPGGRYHNLNDLMGLKNPFKPQLEEKGITPIRKKTLDHHASIFEAIKEKDQILHFPYHSYNYVLRFFNEAAIDPQVEEINVTFYRIASNSLIANALISAVKNGKKVIVFLEVKARFDEENNLRWAEKMEQAGIKIIYSIPDLKVHAKVALVKRKKGNSRTNYAFLGTGNFNEVTAGIYTDHGLMTNNKGITQELDSLFKYLYKRKETIPFQNILVSQFNLQQRFVELIDREIQHTESGKKGKIIIKLNNLEDRIMIDKLYEASNAGVEIQLIIRGICCLIPGLKGYSENITLTRLVDKFLEHARIFWFNNGGKEEIYMGSADWMKRNLYSRIEVVFPLYDEGIKNEVKQILQLQLSDNVKACRLNTEHKNLFVEKKGNSKAVRAQQDIYDWIEKNEAK